MALKKLSSGSRKMDKICVVGLGYVGLPLALAFANAGLDVIGHDIKEVRIRELKQGIDSTNEISKEELGRFNIEYTSEHSKIKEAQVIIVTVPTPIDGEKKTRHKLFKKSIRINR